MPSLLTIVQAADNFPDHISSPYPSHSPDGSERYVPFHLTLADYHASLPPVGLLRPAVLVELRADVGGEYGSPWRFYPAAETASTMDRVDKKAVGLGGRGGDAASECQCCFFAAWVLKQGAEGMSRVVQEAAERWRQEGKFMGKLAGWRNELYQIYASPKSSFFASKPLQGAFANKAFTLERAACAIFGFPTFGVHMTAYEGEGESMKPWVPRRSRTKQTFPGMLDNTVAGGIPAGMSPLDTMVKECGEEASLPESFLLSRIRATGAITEFAITPDGYLQPGVIYTFDLQLSPRTSAEYVEPRPCDGEVESFALMSIPDVLAAMHAGEFKPNCASVLVHFMIRHGMVTADTEPNFIEINWKFGRRLGVAVPSDQT